MIMSVRDYLYNGCKPIRMFLCIKSLLNRLISKGKIVTYTATQTVLLFILIGFTSQYEGFHTSLKTPLLNQSFPLKL